MTGTFYVEYDVEGPTARAFLMISASDVFAESRLGTSNALDAVFLPKLSIGSTKVALGKSWRAFLPRLKLNRCGMPSRNQRLLPYY